MVDDRALAALLSRSIRNVPDFPKPGILFRDITTLLKDPGMFRQAADAFVRRYEGKQISKVVCVESRGFILGAVLASRLGAGFVPVRKSGKLPAERVREEYALEYGTDAVEIHRDSLSPGDRVLVHDDLLATGGTAAATCRLVKGLGGEIVEVAFLIELTFLQGRSRLGNYPVFSLIQYASES